MLKATNRLVRRTSLTALDRQYKADGRPAVWFLAPGQPIAPHLDELLGPMEAGEPK